MGFPKGASIPFAILSIGGGVKSPPAKWLRLIGHSDRHFLLVITLPK